MKMPMHLPALPLCAGAVTAVATLTGNGITAACIVAVCLAATWLRGRKKSLATAVYFCTGLITASISTLNDMPGELPDGIYRPGVTVSGLTCSAKKSANSYSTIILIDSIGSEACKPFRCRVVCDLGEREPCTGDRVKFSAVFESSGKLRRHSAFEQQSLYELSEGIAATAFVGRGASMTVTGNDGSFAARTEACRRRLVQMVYQSGLSVGTASLLAASCLGTADVENDIKQLFRATGLSHLVCVSGFHLGIVAWLISLLLWPLKLWSHAGRVRYAVIIAGIWLYAALTGLQPSAVRAAAMLTCYYLCRLAQIPVTPANTLLLAAGIIIIARPLWLYSPGFQLSTAAVAGLLAFARKYNIFYHRHRLLHLAGNMFAVPAAAITGALPVILFWYGTVPVLSLPVNALVSTVFPLFMGLGAVAVAASRAGMASDILIKLTDGFCKAIETACNFSTDADTTATASGIGLIGALCIAAATAAFAAAMHCNARQRIKWAAATAACAALPLLLHQNANAAITVHGTREGTSVWFCNSDQAFTASTGRPKHKHIEQRIMQHAGIAGPAQTLSFAADGTASHGGRTVAVASMLPDSCGHIDYLIIDSKDSRPVDRLIGLTRPRAVLISADIAPSQRLLIENAARNASVPCCNLASQSFYAPLK